MCRNYRHLQIFIYTYCHFYICIYLHIYIYIIYIYTYVLAPGPDGLPPQGHPIPPCQPMAITYMLQVCIPYTYICSSCQPPELPDTICS